VLTGSCRRGLRWPGLAVEYAWLPPFDGIAKTRPNRLEVVFSAHSGVAIELGGRVHDIDVHPGAMYVVGEEGTTLLNVREHSDTLEMYPDSVVLREAAEWAGIRDFELEPTLRGQKSVTFTRDTIVLSVAHVLRRACMTNLTLSSLEASSIAHLLAQRVLMIQFGVKHPRLSHAETQLSDTLIRELGEYIEENLVEDITLSDLAKVVHLSPFHFARCFKASTGLAPHQYVTARRIDLAKRLVMTSAAPVQEIAWSIGYDNLSHFRRQFAAQFGVVPRDLRLGI